tara:strand:- start:783 stop:1877 length:1095 start_codon:yes stop_codon:yes gene_type:complete
MKKNIIFFHPNINDDGCKKTLEIYCNYLINKFNICLITNTSNKNLLRNLNAKINIVNLKNNFFSKYSFLNEIYCVFKLFKLNYRNPKIISLDGYFILLFLKFLKFNFKLIVRIANPILKNNLNKKLFTTDAGLEIGKLDLIFLKYSDLTILYAEKFKSYLYKKYNLRNIIIIRNYFKKNKIKKRKKKNKIFNIFFIGRLVDIKDPIFFLKNLINLPEACNIKIHIIGKGPLLNNLKLIAKKKKSIVKFHGFVKNPYEKLKHKIDIFCLTSKYDGTPNVLGEAISMKIPCIAPRHVGCVNELLGNGKFGQLYSPKNPKDFQHKLRSIIKNYNKALINADKAYKALDKYSLDNTLKKLERKILSIF